jgi:hypothetical protein
LQFFVQRLYFYVYCVVSTLDCISFSVVFGLHVGGV